MRGIRLLALLGGGFGFGSSLLGRGAHDLLQAARKGAAGVGTDAGQTKERNARHSVPQDTREEAVETKGLLASLGHHDLIPLSWLLALSTSDRGSMRLTYALIHRAVASAVTG